MNRIEQKGIMILAGVMGIWLLLGSIVYLFFYPDNFLIMIRWTLSSYFFIFIGIVFYFLTKKAFSDLLETGLTPEKKKKTK